MPLTFKTGDMFSEATEAIVNTVNCVGVMGKGVALEFKKRWPANFRFYKRSCDTGALQPGRVLVFDTGEMFLENGPRYLINFPTKDHWRAKSKIAFIEDGLDALVDAIDAYKIRSISIPPLGCGNGGLDWSEVRHLIANKLSVLNEVDVIVFQPINSADLPEHAVETIAMTYPRAVLLKALGEIEHHFDGAFDRISLQKIVYFLQAMGVDFRLQFARNLHGPYSDALKKAFVIMDQRGMISGFLSGDRLAHVTPAGYATSSEYLEAADASLSGGADEIIERLDKLIQGYESPYGMELLSSVRWLAHDEGVHPVEKVIEALANWNEGKRNSFDEKSIRSAYMRLEEDGLLGTTLDH